MNVYVMKQIWFKVLMGVLALASLITGVLLSANQAQAQGAATPAGVLATVIYTDPINVRGGPSTVKYPIVGQLAPGEIVPALGVSPGHEWVQIVYPGTADGTGWVYAIFVSISGGELRIVEPPPTPTPPVTATIDLTLAAQFNTQPTQTRLPTFTPPPPLEIVNVTPDVGSRHFVPGMFIVVLGLVGIVGLAVSFILKK
jgi:uncharacterized protein YraI